MVKKKIDKPKKKVVKKQPVLKVKKEVKKPVETLEPVVVEEKKIRRRKRAQKISPDRSTTVRSTTDRSTTKEPPVTLKETTPPPAAQAGPVKPQAEQTEIKPEPKPEIKKEEPIKVLQEKLVKSVVIERKKIKIQDGISVGELAYKLGIKVPEFIKKLISIGVMATINQRLDKETIRHISDGFNCDIEVMPSKGFEVFYEGVSDKPSDLLPRAPVVTIMGHVDHGKTSLLDAIRESNLISQEAGGITQHIGAYKINTKGGSIVFLDTPGHEAFTAMRARGSKVTDIVVVVVAADDGVMPQTVEAINHARAAGVPIVVAINKIDLPNSNPQKVKQELSNYNLIPEEWGGKDIFAEISAKKREGIENLLNMLLLVAEMLELKANPNRSAEGTVIEARLDSQRGAVATVLIQKGTLNIGECFISGLTWGKVRAMFDEHNNKLKQARPSTPVEILGFNWTSHAGDKFIAVKSEKEARTIAEKRKGLFKIERIITSNHISLVDLHKQISEGKIKELNMIIKCDVRGSLEAIKDSIERFKDKEIKINIIHRGIGTITESDILLASASNAIVIGFNISVDEDVLSLAEKEGVDVRIYKIIYDLLEDIKNAIEGLIAPELKDVFAGKAECKKVFNIPKMGVIAGCYIHEGKVSRNLKAKIFRNGKSVYEGKVASIRRFKDDVKEVEKGFECGIGFENFSDIKVGDIIEVLTVEKTLRKITPV